MDEDKDRNRDRVTGSDVQGQRDMNRWIGQRQEEGQSDRADVWGQMDMDKEEGDRVKVRERDKETGTGTGVQRE